MKFLSVRGIYDYAGSLPGSRYRLLRVLPSPCVHKVGTPNWFFEAQYPRPTNASVYALRPASRQTRTRLEVMMVRYFFPVRLFHSLLHAGLSRRSDAHLFCGFRVHSKVTVGGRV